MDDLERSIKSLIEATNRGDSLALLESFADDAILIDFFGESFVGKSAIAQWNDAQNIGLRNQITATGVARSGATVTLRISVSGTGYNGPGTFVFEIEGGLIRQLLVTA